MNGGAVLLLGASVRALAESVRAAGDVPIACDLFGDEDLRAVAKVEVLPIGEYPHGFAAVARKHPQAPRIYTGGLENYPHLIAELATDGPLWGNSPTALRQVRDPDFLARAAQSMGVRFPETRRDSRGVDPRDGWLTKPLRGSAGRGIRLWDGDALPPDYCLQKLMPGKPWSAAFVRFAQGCLLLGATRQIVGASWTGAPPFAYAGNVGPLELPSDATAAIRGLGKFVAQEIDLRGVFGLDFLLDDNRTTLLEVNPRYTASMELYERAGYGSIYAWHRCAFTEERAPPAHPTTRTVGKVVVYAERDAALPTAFDWLSVAESLGGRFADIPAAGSRIAAGAPIATFLTDGLDAAEVETKLRAGALRLRARANEATDSSVR